MDGSDAGLRATSEWLRFTDVGGNDGVIDADLSLEYEGPHREDLERYLAEARDRYGTDDRPAGAEVRDVFQNVMIDIYGEFPITATELVDDR